MWFPVDCRKLPRLLSARSVSQACLSGGKHAPPPTRSDVPLPVRLRMQESCGLLGPRPEGCPKAVRRNWPLTNGIPPIFDQRLLFMRLRTASRAMFDKGLFLNTRSESRTDCICRMISEARAGSGIRPPVLRCRGSLRFANGMVQIVKSKSKSFHDAFRTASVRAWSDSGTQGLAR